MGKPEAGGRGARRLTSGSATTALCSEPAPAATQAAAAMQAPTPRGEEALLEVGAQVVVVRLRKYAELNGALGVLLGRAGEKWHVRLASGGGEKLIRAGNLERLPSA